MPMKLDEGFIIRSIAGEDVLVPIGSKVIDFKGLMTLSPVAAFNFRQLEEGKAEDEIVAAILAGYEIDEATARADLREFLGQLRELGVLSDERRV
jgi:hypothetical protein